MLTFFPRLTVSITSLFAKYSPYMMKPCQFAFRFETTKTNRNDYETNQNQLNPNLINGYATTF